jgi:AraC-like DNA-binding protein
VTDVVDEHVRAAPGPVMRGLAVGYVGYLQRGVAPRLHTGVASPWLTLILTLDDPLWIERHVDITRGPRAYESLLGGVHVRPVIIRHGGAQSGVQVQVSPLAARRLCGVPAGELTDLDLPAEDMLGAGVVDEVRASMLAATDWAARFTVLARVLGTKLHDEGSRSDEVSWAWRRLLRTRGRITVRELAAETGWSERHLANRLRQETGFTPKRAARVIRFDHARRLVQADRASLAAVAATCGYVDESHMSRDFVEMAGAPPRRWASGEFGKVQSAWDEARGRCRYDIRSAAPDLAVAPCAGRADSDPVPR